MITQRTNLPMDRRTAIQWMASAIAFLAVESRFLGAVADLASLPAVHGYGTDPDLQKIYGPGDIWPLTLTASQRQTVATLCDVIIPADAKSPSASAVGVPSFIDEWISAPYPNHTKDRKTVLDGIVWLEAEAQRRFQRSFTDLAEAQRRAICDDICWLPNAKSENRSAAAFFAKFRDLTAGGYYTTKEGMEAIGYVGNRPMVSFPGPPVEALKQLGLR